LPGLSRYPRFPDLLGAGPDEDGLERLSRAETIGRPLGDDAFLRQLEAATGRTVRPGKRGPKPRPASDASLKPFIALSP